MFLHVPYIKLAPEQPQHRYPKMVDGVDGPSEETNELARRIAPILNVPRGKMLDFIGRNKMQPTNPNAHTYVNGTDVKTHGYAVTHNTFLQ